MSIVINTNVPSLSAQRALRETRRNQDASLRKLASGSRITRSADDAAGLAISEKLRAGIRSIRQASRNAQDGVSMVQTAEGGLSSVSDMVIRMRELAIQSASDTVGDEERGFTDLEFQALKSEIDRVAKGTEFNGNRLLDGSGGVYDFQVGMRNDPILDRISFDATSLDSSLESLGLLSESVSTKIGAQNTLSVLDGALQRINGGRAELGALQNRLVSTQNNLGVADENLSAANSRIRDVDIASETSKLTKSNILASAGVSVLSQANQVPHMALKLLG